MILRAIVVVAVAALVAIPATVVAEDGNARDGTRSGSGPRSGSDGGPRVGEEPQTGAFAVGSGSDVNGDFVSFHYSTAGLSGFALEGLVLFDATVASSARQDGPPLGAQTDGSEIRVSAPSYSVQAHDNPTAEFRMVARSVITLTFPSSARITGSGERVEIDIGNVTAQVFGDGLRVNGSSVTGMQDVQLIVNHARGLFDIHRAAIDNATAHHAIGAEISLSHRANAGDTVNYGNVTVTPTRVTLGNITLVVAGHGFDGRVLVVDIDPALLGNGTLAFRFDNESMIAAKNLTDAMDPDAHGLKASYYVVRDTDGVQVIVAVPHYSTHTLTISSVLEVATPTVVVGVTVGLLMLAGGATVLFRRPKA
ncbi:MAG: hypothetical protein ACYDCK_14395 [Thermoplasmatota archaeon]